jgi:ATP-dependent helicase/DNAse subunit B
MVADVRILCCRTSPPRTERLLRQNAKSALWIVPNRRAVESLRPRIDAATSPLTFPEFGELVVRANEAGAQILSDVQRRLLLLDLLHQNRKHLSHFHSVLESRGFLDNLGTLIAELKQNAINPDEFARALPPGTRIAQCARLYKAYQKHLLGRHLFDREGCSWHARRLLREGPTAPFEAVRVVYADGFSDFTRTQEQMLAALCPWLDALWITLPLEEGTQREELFTQPRRTLERLAPLNPAVEFLPAPTNPLLPGLPHVERQLFRPLRRVEVAEKADGIEFIEAPGSVGEVRLVARKIKTLLVEGVAPDAIMVTLREALPFADLIREVFNEYGIPHEMEGSDPLARNPAVATLLRRARLPDDDWPFADVTALLRSNYFAPDWEEVRADPEVAQHAEVLLRLLGEPRGREAYLRAVARWRDDPPPGLEDEQAEESRRRRTHELAKRCSGFLERFFRAWEGRPKRGTFTKHGQWLRAWAGDLGIVASAQATECDAAALRALWDEFEAWHAFDRRSLDRPQFFHALTALASAAGLPRTERGPGRVRVLSANLVSGLEVDHLFVMGLGERSFPRLEDTNPLLDESHRQALRQAGLEVLRTEDALADEMLLFFQVVTAARERLVLSYAAIDDKGQDLLPGSFLATLRDCFRPEALTVHRQQMLIQGYRDTEPLCPREQRIQWACLCGIGLQPVETPDRLQTYPTADTLANLHAAREMAARRFHPEQHGPYDGLLRHPAALAELQSLFGPERILSPTALEGYIACPFRFFLGQVLRLEPLEEPREEVESTDRGLAFHRALSRLHRHLRDEGIHQPVAEVEARLLARLDEAAGECAVRSSPASEALWRIEAERMKRLGTRYRDHWLAYLDPWIERSLHLKPHAFEVAFGLPAAEGEIAAGPLVLRFEDVEVRVSGRIDRVDVVEFGEEVGFWILDYKTGRSGYYTANEIKEFRRLQLTLYALAVERVLLAGKQSRPLGLAYWLVADTGVKVALPSPNRPLAWFEEPGPWRLVRERLERWVVTLVRHIRRGDFPLKPRSEQCTQTCDFGQICRISQARETVENKRWNLPLPTL